MDLTLLIPCGFVFGILLFVISAGVVETDTTRADPFCQYNDFGSAIKIDGVLGCAKANQNNELSFREVYCNNEACYFIDRGVPS